ncbi:hypothetical protein [Polymorphobacter sp.]|uniref:hypothetical protein n=1 Tax=Polymorphobacter sp. TaxID=1909290 RepID=UPI003F7034B3
MTDATLDAMSTDDLARITMALVQQVWIMRDRMAITEKLLETKAGITPEMIDDYVQTPDVRAELEKLRALYVSRVVGAPLAARQRTVPDILKRGGF